MFLDLGTRRWLEMEEMVWMVRLEKLEEEDIGERQGGELLSAHR